MALVDEWHEKYPTRREVANQTCLLRDMERAARVVAATEAIIGDRRTKAAFLKHHPELV